MTGEEVMDIVRREVVNALDGRNVSMNLFCIKKSWKMFFDMLVFKSDNSNTFSFLKPLICSLESSPNLS